MSKHQIKIITMEQLTLKEAERMPNGHKFLTRGEILKVDATGSYIKCNLCTRKISGALCVHCHFKNWTQSHSLFLRVSLTILLKLLREKHLINVFVFYKNFSTVLISELTFFRFVENFVLIFCRQKL